MNKDKQIINNKKMKMFLVLRLSIVLSVIFIITGLVGSANALSNDITLSSPTLVDMSGHEKSDIHAGEVVGFSSTITNHAIGEKRFTYVVLVLNHDNQIESNEGLSATIGPGQTFVVDQSWIPKESGTYQVHTFLLNGYLLSNPLTDVINTQISVK